MRFLPAVEDLLGSALIAYCIFMLSSVRAVVALTTEPDRSWLLRRLIIHRLLMAAFLVGGVIEAVLSLSGPVGPDTILIATVNLLGSVFIYFGIMIKRRMGLAMQKTIAELVPICAWCKQVRISDPKADDAETWITMETYLTTATRARLTHGICADCAAKMKAHELAGRA